MKNLALVTLLLNSSLSVFAQTNTASPHFNLVVQNASSQNAAVFFKPGVGNVSLIPTMGIQNLDANSATQNYQVVIEPLVENATFSVFTPSQNNPNDLCEFDVGFYKPGFPKVTTFGQGCKAAGFHVDGETLTLIVDDLE